MRSRTGLVAGVIALIAALAIAGAAGWLIRGDSASTPSTTSVDAGFVRDMSTHHEQAVTMAAYARDHTTNASVELLARNIADAQAREIGRFSGWLDAWGLNYTDPAVPQMAWMSHGSAHSMLDPATGLMPGLATQAQMTELLKSTGTKLDILFLQLMIHHHQGGLQMAQYAAAHASESYVRTAARQIVTGQSAEIIDMEQLLRQLGGTELPPPAS